MPHIRRTLEQACRYLERNEPAITNGSIGFEDGQTCIHLEKPFFLFYVDESESSVALWRRIGRAIRNNRTLRICYLHINSRFDAEAVQPAHIRAFLDELKDNKSITGLYFEPIDRFLPVFNLGYFLRNNTNIKAIALSSDSRSVTLEQSNIISTALDGVQLEAFDMDRLEFGNNGAMEQILSHCSGVEEMSMFCYRSFHYTALASLLRNPRAILQTLTITTQDWDQEFGEEDERLALREILIFPRRP